MTLLPHYDFLSKQTDGVLRKTENHLASARSRRELLLEAYDAGDLSAAAAHAQQFIFITAEIDKLARGPRGPEVIAHLKHMEKRHA